MQQGEEKVIVSTSGVLLVECPGSPTVCTGTRTVLVTKLPSAYRYSFEEVHGSHRYRMASWRGYANMILDRIKYVGAGSSTNRSQWRLHMAARGDRGDYDSFSFAHVTDRMVPETRPWGLLS